MSTGVGITTTAEHCSISGTLHAMTEEWVKDWLEGRLRFEDLTLEQRTYLLKRYKEAALDQA